jgi:MFS transporter, PAT family, beta-lactamase induction signal transducer AmpG
LPSDERGTANGMMFAGQAIGQALGGSGVLLISASLPFKSTFLLVTAAMGLILVCVSWRLREPTVVPVWAVAKRTVAPLVRVGLEILEFVRAAGRAFVGTRAAAVGVVFAALPLGAYALALSLQSNLAVELGLDDASIGMLGLMSSLMSAAGCVLGGWLSDRFGRRRMLGLFIALTAVPTVWLALAMQGVGYIMSTDVTLADRALPAPALVATFWTMCIVFNFFQGLTYGSSMALFMDITTPAVAATQFTAYMALGNLVTSYTATWQGVVISHYGYPITLLLDASFGLIAILLLPWLGTARITASRGAAVAAGVN